MSIRWKRRLNEDLTLRDELISDGMALLLLNKHSYRRPADESLDSQLKRSAPNEQEIRDATEDLANKNWDRIVVEMSNTIDFQKELRKILVSLIDYSIDLLKSHSEVKRIFGDDFDFDSIDGNVVSTEEEDNEKDGLDGQLLKQLTDMGFAAERAKRALKLNNMSAIDAMDWLLANESVGQSNGALNKSD